MTARSFSIYLLKLGRDATNSLKQGHALQAVPAANLPNPASIFILDAPPKEPWWKAYFGIAVPLFQQYKGALVFLPVANRCFALSFGSVFHHLEDDCYEYDFGLRVTLNSLDPNELKSADMLDPGAARRTRTQVPSSRDLTYLDFDANSEILKSLTGKIKPEYQHIMKGATGSTALRVSLDVGPAQLAATCGQLLELYSKDDYRREFPNIENIKPISDPALVRELDNLLVTSLRNKSDDVTLVIPDIIDYRDNTCCVFAGGGDTSDVFPDITIEEFYEFWELNRDMAALSPDMLRSFRMQLTDVEGKVSRSYSMHRSLIFETTIAGRDGAFHLCEGNWYRVEPNFLNQLDDYINGKCEDCPLPPYNHDAIQQGKAVYSEGNYNAAIPALIGTFICLDQTNISPAGHTQIEPCDLYVANMDATASCGRRATMYHLKISTRSSSLSHLFNQGINAVELVGMEPTVRANLVNLVTARLNGNPQVDYVPPISSMDFKIVFGIITHKDKALKASNLPLFSKITLKRVMQHLELMKIPSALSFIADNSPKKAGHGKRKTLTVEVSDVGGKREVKPIAGQGVDPASVIKGAPKPVRDAVPGSQFILEVVIQADGTIKSFHKWKFSAVP